MTHAPARVVTLLPSATEIVHALGAFDALVACSHDCDFPDGVRALPRVTTTPIRLDWTSGAIDAEVVRLREAGRPVIALDAEALRALRPDALITQSLCDVCAVSDGEAFRIADLLDPAPRVLALEAADLEGIRRDIRAVGALLARPDAAEAVVAGMDAELAALAAGRPAAAPRVLCLEWLDPPYLGGHWVPELVALAGGVDPLARPGDRSRRATWAELRTVEADLAVVMLCGFGPDRARAELDAMTDPDALAVLARQPVWLLDGGAFASRPGPRVAGGATRLQAAMHGRAMPGLERWR